MGLPGIHGMEVSCWVHEGEKRSDLQCVHENSAFTIEVRSGTAVFRFKYPLSSFEEAEERVNDFLRSWEGDMLLQVGQIPREFRIEGCRAPGYGGHAYAYLKYSVAGALAEENTRRQTPWRRHRYWGIPLIDALVQRYEDYRNGRERLTVMAYLCLSALQHAFGGRKAVAVRLKIEPAVLNELGRITSEVGSYGSARKIDQGHELRELTSEEEHWILSVTRHLIDRAGAVFSKRDVKLTLGLGDLPKL